MSVNPQDNQAQATEQSNNDKEYNFSQLRKQAEHERYLRQQAELKLQEAEKQLQAQPKHDDDDDDEPYVDRRKLKKELSKFEQNTKQVTQNEVQKQVQAALSEERRQNWLRANGDFQEVMSHAQTFAEKDPELAEAILDMPDTFERQKLVYKNIKALGLHRKEEPKPSIQDTIEKNKRSPYYQPSSIGTAPYAAAGDYSATGQKSAYDKMQSLKKRLNLG